MAKDKTDKAAPAVHTAAKSSATVTVACNIPNGIVLQLCKKVKWIEQTRDGNMDRVRWDKVGPRLVLAGPAYPNGQIPDGFKEKPMIAGGYALTHDIPKDFWDEWLDQNAESSFVVNKQVFAQSALADAQSQAREQRDVRSGFEPINRDLDPKKDPRLPTPIAGLGVGLVSQAEEQKGRAAA